MPRKEATIRRAAVLAVLGLLALAGPADARAVRHSPLQLEDGHGIHVESVWQADERQIAARVSTEALQHPVEVRIILPVGYAAEPRRRYPALYLFHGTSGRSSDWIVAGDAVATTAGIPLIVVLPDAGFDGDGGGWFADWYNGGAGGQPMWETFHIAQVIPWIDANLRTIPRRDGRAVAGLSQGGFGALSYAARHPDLFTSTAAFSGACQIDRDPEAIEVATAIVRYTTSALSGEDPDAIFGPRPLQNHIWQSHDPATLVTNLRGTMISLWTGNGDPGPLDPPGRPTDAIEVITYGATRLFLGHLNDEGIPSAYHDYGPGTHTWGYWARDLREHMEPLMRRFGDPPARPGSVDYLSGADRWQQWGWQVTLKRPAPAFSRLTRARRSGFELTGTGTASVRTPGVYRPGALLRVTMQRTTGRSRRTMTVGENGRLRISVPLGDGSAPMTTRVRLRQVAASP